MIKFFRKIRYDLMEQNKTGSSAEASAKAGKYLKYAIGEVILVVIGILIALQINNWNESRKIMQQETLALKQLKKDLLSEAIFINDANKNFNENLLYLKEVSNGNYENVDMASFFLKIASTLDFSAMTSETKYLGLKFNGNLDIISNNVLREKIIEFYENMHPDLESTINYHETFVMEQIEPSLVDKLPLNEDLSITNTKTAIVILNSSNLKTKVNYQIFYHKRFIKTFAEITQSINEVVSFIDDELNNK